MTFDQFSAACNQLSLRAVFVRTVDGDRWVATPVEDYASSWRPLDKLEASFICDPSLDRSYTCIRVNYLRRRNLMVRFSQLHTALFKPALA